MAVVSDAEHLRVLQPHQIAHLLSRLLNSLYAFKLLNVPNFNHRIRAAADQQVTDPGHSGRRSRGPQKEVALPPLTSLLLPQPD